MSIVAIIQSMLAPGIMISACGLLLLGMNNKYSIVVNRIRLLDDEKRKLKSVTGAPQQNPTSEGRLMSITMQLEKFAYRVKLVRNAVLSYSLAVAFFIISSLLIGLNFAITGANIFIIVVILFLTGMLSVLIGVIFAAMEVIKGYEIVRIETQE
mgnify:FL=1